MAKISARGATEMARLSFERSLPSGDTYSGILVLRSDGKVLIRHTGDTPSGYTVLSSLHRPARADAATVLRNVAAARRFTITREGK